MNKGIITISIAVGAAVVGLVLYWWGQPLICTCGYVKLWAPNIFSAHNSQHIIDWYTFGHMVHGLLMILIARLVLRWNFVASFWLAFAAGIGWELIEHTDFVLERFRSATVAQGYYGDSVLNAVGDFIIMMGMFVWQWKWKVRHIVLSIVLLEVFSSIFGRESLLISSIMLIYPIEFIETWQRGIEHIYQ